MNQRAKGPTFSQLSSILSYPELVSGDETDPESRLPRRRRFYNYRAHRWSSLEWDDLMVFFDGNRGRALERRLVAPADEPLKGIVDRLPRGLPRSLFNDQFLADCLDDGLLDRLRLSEAPVDLIRMIRKYNKNLEPGEQIGDGRYGARPEESLAPERVDGKQRSPAWEEIDADDEVSDEEPWDPATHDLADEDLVMDGETDIMVDD